jgi:hypothetical protein
MQVIVALHSIENEHRASRDQERSYEKKKGRRESLTIIGIFLTAVAAIVTVAVTHHDTARAIKEARIAANTQHNDTIAALDLSTKTSAAQIQQMTAQAQAAKTQADAAKIAADTAQDNLVSGSRAWVGPTDARFDTPALTVGADASVDIMYLNTGREPARSFTFASYRTFVPTQADAADAIGENLQKCTTSNDVSASQVVYPAVGIGGGNQMKITIPGKDVDDDLVKGHKTLVVLGCMTYYTFGEIRRSAFCFYYKAPDTKPDHFGYCTEGGYAD